MALLILIGLGVYDKLGTHHDLIVLSTTKDMDQEQADIHMHTIANGWHTEFDEHLMETNLDEDEEPWTLEETLDDLLGTDKYHSFKYGEHVIVTKYTSCVYNIALLLNLDIDKLGVTDLGFNKV